MTLTKADAERTRLDVFISGETELSRSAAARAIEDGCVKVNGVAVNEKKYAVTMETVNTAVLTFEDSGTTGMT